MQNTTTAELKTVKIVSVEQIRRFKDSRKGPGPNKMRSPRYKNRFADAGGW